MDYEPEFFRASDGEVSSVAERLPLVINIGSLKTPTVDMRLKYAGLDSLLFDDLCQVNQCEKSATPARSAADAASIFQGTHCASIADNLQKLAVTGGGSPFSTQGSATNGHVPERELTNTERITNFM